MKALARTPWGAPHYSRELAPGIVLYGTAGHGGIHLDRTRRRAMPAALRAIPTYAGGPWYEEDCDWALVALAFPDAFEPETVAGAIRTAKRYHAQDLDLDAYLRPETGRRCVARAHGHRFVDNPERVDIDRLDGLTDEQRAVAP